MPIALLASDIMMASRVHAAADAAGVSILRSSSPDDLPTAADVPLLIVDWSERTDGWGGAITAWRGGAGTRVVVYGQHTDLEAHAAARAAGLGPMWARSRLVRELPRLIAASVR